MSDIQNRRLKTLRLILAAILCATPYLSVAQPTSAQPTSATTTSTTTTPAVAGAAPIACVAPTERFDAAMLDANARLLAGYPVANNAAITALANSQSGKAHATSMAATWKKLDERQLNKVKLFAKEFVATPAGNAPLFYPFSGPDLLYAEALFPAAPQYLLTGLEPVGAVPDISKFSAGELAASLADLRKSLNSILAFSFFRTNDMRVDFRKNRLIGVVPVLMTFAVKSGFSVQSASFFVLSPDGIRCTTDASKLAQVKSPNIAGVEMGLLRAGETLPRKLIYLSADIGDGGLAKTPQYEKLVTGFGHRATFLKSASFLMHKDYFSKVRNLILSTSSVVLQDDSGIPYRSFDVTRWQANFFGNYVKPIPLFANYNQKDLHAAFKSIGSKPMDFGIGYRYSKQDSSLLLFTKK